MPQYRGAWLFAQLAMRLRARRSSVTAVHVTDPDALTQIRGRKLLATVYDLIPLQEGIDARRFIAWAGYRAYLRALRRVDTHFAISSQTESDLNRLLGVQESSIVVASPGIELPPASDRIWAGDDSPYFLFVGGPNRNKNSDLLLDALAICNELPHRLLIAGRWLPKQLEALQGQLQVRGLLARVEHLGFVPDADLVSLMRHACALVVPSRQEGFGLPVGEGLAAGAVVIHSRIPVLEETAGGATLTFEPDSATELAECLRRVAGDAHLGDDLRRRGIQRARDLTWNAAVASTVSAYRALLGGGATTCE